MLLFSRRVVRDMRLPLRLPLRLFLPRNVPRNFFPSFSLLERFRTTFYAAVDPPNRDSLSQISHNIIARDDDDAQK
jgi:hypothetical protein